jgi:hypothetical protein
MKWEDILKAKQNDILQSDYIKDYFKNYIRGEDAKRISRSLRLIKSQGKGLLKEFKVNMDDDKYDGLPSYDTHEEKVNVICVIDSDVYNRESNKYSFTDNEMTRLESLFRGSRAKETSGFYAQALQKTFTIKKTYDSNRPFLEAPELAYFLERVEEAL